MSDEKKKSAVPLDPAGAMESAFLLGIGMLEMGREKSQSLANELIEKGKLSQSDVKKVTDKVSEIAEEQQESLRKTVAQETDRAVKTSGLATKDEVAELKAQIAELKEMLAAATKTEAPAKK
jgi:polyhydroxyalkanoate synthesis regulator phasin